MINYNGGPAFPTLTVIGDQSLSEVGVTMRDYFAAKAMQGLIGDTHEMMAEIATSAYMQADAMIKARNIK